jgi:tRNA A37 threonylcarbamoyladenosine synthetase subunit TsaC/SUA5/YrdC
LAEVPESIRHGADLVINGGELPGVSSTVIDLTRFETDGTWHVVRAGALSDAAIAKLLAVAG